jgi:hypothetical protein
MPHACLQCRRPSALDSLNLNLDSAAACATAMEPPQGPGLDMLNSMQAKKDE